MHIGVIATMKCGLEHFIYREMLYLEEEGATISLFPTKQNRGLYEPKDSWRVHYWRFTSVLLAQLYWLCKSPLKYLSLLAEAIHVGAVPEVMLAWTFAEHFAAVDVIYATFGDRKLFVGYFAKRIVGKPLAVEIHAYELYKNPNPRLFARALSVCDRIVTVSEHNHQLLTQKYGIDPAAVEVVRYSIDLEDYRPTKKFIILIVAFFVERKGHEILFQAVKELNCHDIEIWVVGDVGSEPPVDVRRLAVELGVADRVAFFGRLNGAALKAVYHACDVFCLPCRVDSRGICEGFPNVLIEAMACGKPVITTRHVEIPLIIPEVLVDENDVQGLADAITHMIESGSLRTRLGEQNRRLAEQHFSKRNSRRTATLLRELAEVPSAGTPNRDSSER